MLQACGRANNWNRCMQDRRGLEVSTLPNSSVFHTCASGRAKSRNLFFFLFFFGPLLFLSSRRQTQQNFNGLGLPLFAVSLPEAIDMAGSGLAFVQTWRNFTRLGLCLRQLFLGFLRKDRNLLFFPLVCVNFYTSTIIDGRTRPKLTNLDFLSCGLEFWSSTRREAFCEVKGVSTHSWKI